MQTKSRILGTLMKLDELTRACKLRLGMIPEGHPVLYWRKAGQSENYASIDTHCEEGEVEKEGHTLLFQLSKFSHRQR